MNHLLPALLILLTTCASAAEYDLIIRNGTLYDGSGAPPVRGDVAVNGDTIARIGDLGDSSARQEVDAQGLAVAPGFINMLSWANVSLIEDGRSQSDIRQGVTLEVMGEGFSMGPWNDAIKAETLEKQTDIRYAIEWTTLGEYLQYLEDRGVSTNVASFVGNGTLRQYVIGYDNRPATADELAAMKTLLDGAMREGAMGLSSSLLYAPSMYADTAELTELARVAGRHGGMYVSHIRDEGDRLLESIDELITIAREANVPAEVYHLKASGQPNWPKLETAIERIEQARADGLAITADIYTYHASSTGLHVQLPDWAREGGIDAAIARLRDPDTRAKILSEITFRNGPDSILLVGFRNPELRKYIGRRLDELAAELGKSPAETMVDLIVEDNSRVQVVYFSMSEDNIRRKMAVPWIAFCSDAASMAAEGVFLEQSTHPRAYGSFARVLGKFSRDEGILSLEEAIRRLTGFPAENLKLDRRGRLAPGHFADIVVFDPARVRDRATFEQPHQYAEGMVHVWVNGEQVLRDGAHTGARPGRFVKGPGARDD
ncbi:MAG: D-aminoacylase [Xanthomonadales bacterium]